MRISDVFDEYERHLGRPGKPRDAVEWGLNRGLLTTPDIDPVAVLTTDMVRALRAQTRTDGAGRTYRAKQSVTFTNDGGVQDSLWGDIDRITTPRDFVIESFGQRRKGILDDCSRLKNDVDHYNAHHPEHEPVQLSLDFTDDVAEREALHDPPSDPPIH